MNETVEYEETPNEEAEISEEEYREMMLNYVQEVEDAHTRAA